MLNRLVTETVRAAERITRRHVVYRAWCRGMHCHSEDWIEAIALNWKRPRCKNCTRIIP